MSVHGQTYINTFEEIEIIRFRRGFIERQEKILGHFSDK